MLVRKTIFKSIVQPLLHQLLVARIMSIDAIINMKIPATILQVLLFDISTKLTLIIDDRGIEVSLIINSLLVNITGIMRFSSKENPLNERFIDC